jgi:hypothetical protein
MEDYHKALEGDPVGKAHNIVAACCKSGQCQSDLLTVITNGNNDSSWKLHVVQLL